MQSALGTVINVAVTDDKTDVGAEKQGKSFWTKEHDKKKSNDTENSRKMKPTDKDLQNNLVINEINQICFKYQVIWLVLSR